MFENIPFLKSNTERKTPSLFFDLWLFPDLGFYFNFTIELLKRKGFFIFLNVQGWGISEIIGVKIKRIGTTNIGQLERLKPKP